MYMWRSEVACLLSVLTLHLKEFRLLGMVASALTQSTISWDLACFEIYRGDGFSSPAAPQVLGSQEWDTPGSSLFSLPPFQLPDLLEASLRILQFSFSC